MKYTFEIRFFDKAGKEVKLERCLFQLNIETEKSAYFQAKKWAKSWLDGQLVRFEIEKI